MTRDFIDIYILIAIFAIGTICFFWLIFSVVDELAHEWDKKHKGERGMTTNDPTQNLFKRFIKAYLFAQWVADEIFDDMWEYNKDAFAEIACRKLEKLGIVRQEGDEWVKESSDADSN